MRYVASHQIAAVIALSLPAMGQANDTTARVGVGGLVFTKTNAIAMASEHLVISPERISVSYVYRNTGDRDVTTVVAFPTPAYPSCLSESQTEQNQRPVEHLSTRVDGEIVRTSHVRSAVIGSNDVTAKLRAAGLTESQIFPPMSLPFCTLLPEGDPLTAAQRRRLKGVLPKGEWQTTDTYHWTQTFPARGTVKVSHEYKPFPGGIAGYANATNLNDSTWIPVSSSSTDASDNACVDERARALIVNRARRLISQGAKDVQIFLKDVEYILGTARNWKGPISSFTLDLVKEGPDDVVSLCFPGRARRLDATTLRFEHQHFAPPDRVRVNFYSVNAVQP